MKRLLLLALVLLSSFLPWCRAVAADLQDTPDARATAFYTWFIEHDTDTSYPLKMPAIEQYVLPETVSRLRDDYARSGPPGDIDYFLKVQDYDGHDWLSHIKTSPAIMLGDVAVVPVTFGSKDQTSVLVFMRMSGGTWKITKVDDTRDYR